MISSYYFWKWADNDLPGKPNQVFSALLRGELHPALQTFDAQPLESRLESFAAKRRNRGEEWNWQVHPSDNPTRTRFVFLAGPDLNDSKSLATSFWRALNGLKISGYDEQCGHVIHSLEPKLNCLLYGQDHQERHYDITSEEVPSLLRRIDRKADNPYAVLTDRRDYFVQCYSHERRFCVEWRENYDSNNFDDFAHWRASALERLKADREMAPRRHGHSDHDTLTFADTARIFQAFTQGDAKPSRYRWRSIKSQLARETTWRKKRKQAKQPRRKAASHD